jgi:glutaminase
MRRIRQTKSGLLLLGALFAFLISIPALAQTPEEIQAALDAAYEKYRDLTEGKKADHNPAVARLDPGLFGIALVTVDGKIYTAGETGPQVSMASVSKVFTMAHVFQESGPEAVRNNIGVDATGEVYNSIAAIERDGGKEMNSMVNAGAIATTSMVKGETKEEIWNNLLNTFSAFAGRQLSMSEEVYRADSSTNRKNQAIATLMFAYGRIEGDPMQACDLYTRHCAISVNVKDLAVMAGALANFGKNPVTGRQVLDAEHVPEALAVMATAGLYDDAGQWLFETGLPAKSGVSGGIIAISPGKFGIATVSPPLDAAGNSVRGQKAIRDISNALGGNPYSPGPK